MNSKDERQRADLTEFIRRGYPGLGYVIVEDFYGNLYARLYNPLLWPVEVKGIEERLKRELEDYAHLRLVPFGEEEVLRPYGRGSGWFRGAIAPEKTEGVATACDNSADDYTFTVTRGEHTATWTVPVLEGDDMAFPEPIIAMMSEVTKPLVIKSKADLLRQMVAEDGDEKLAGYLDRLVRG